MPQEMFCLSHYCQQSEGDGCCGGGGGGVGGECLSVCMYAYMLREVRARQHSMSLLPLGTGLEWYAYLCGPFVSLCVCGERDSCM